MLIKKPKITSPESTKAKRSLSFWVTAEDIERATEAVARRYRAQVRLKGFRPGRAPIELVKQLFGREIKEDAQEEAIALALRRELEERDLSPVAPVKLKKVEESSEGGLFVEAEVEVIPDFELPPLAEIRVENRIPRVSEDEVEAEIRRMAEELAEFEEVDREAREGDVLVVEITEQVKDTQEVLNKNKRTFLPLDPQQFQESFIRRFIGARKGDVLTFEDRIEDVDIVVRYRVLSVREKRVPPIDDDLAQAMGYESLEELRNVVREELFKELKKRAEERLEDQIVEEIYRRSPFELPPSLVEHYVELLKNRLWGKDVSVGQLDPKLQEHLRESAEHVVKREIILLRVAEEAGLSVSEKEVSEEIRRIAREEGKPPSKVRKEIDRRALEQHLLKRKAMDYLKSVVHAEVIFT